MNRLTIPQHKLRSSISTYLVRMFKPTSYILTTGTFNLIFKDP